MNDDEEEVEEAEPAVVVTRSAEQVDPKTIKRITPKKIITAALSVGFDVRAHESDTFEAGAPFKGGARQGERRPDKTITHLSVTGTIPRAAAFLVRFKDYSFSNAIVWDAAGWPTELYHDYSQSANAVRRVKDEPEWAWRERIERLQHDAKRRSYEYNDGEMWVNHNPRLVRNATEFDEWFADLVPDYKPRARHPKKEDEVTNAILSGEDWIG